MASMFLSLFASLLLVAHSHPAGLECGTDDSTRLRAGQTIMKSKVAAAPADAPVKIDVSGSIVKITSKAGTHFAAKAFGDGATLSTTDSSLSLTKSCTNQVYTVSGNLTTYTFQHAKAASIVVGYASAPGVVSLVTAKIEALAAPKEEKLIKVNIQRTMSDKRPLSYSRGSSACWGIPGLAPQQDGSINVVPDEGNFACACHNDTSCDYYANLLVPMYLDARWDILHKMEDMIGELKFTGLGKNISGKMEWTYQCHVIDGDAKHKISCETAKPPSSQYALAFLVSLADPSAKANEYTVV